MKFDYMERFIRKIDAQEKKMKAEKSFQERQKKFKEKETGKR